MAFVHWAIFSLSDSLRCCTSSYLQGGYGNSSDTVVGSQLAITHFPLPERARNSLEAPSLRFCPLFACVCLGKSEVGEWNKSRGTTMTVSLSLLSLLSLPSQSIPSFSTSILHGYPPAHKQNRANSSSPQHTNIRVRPLLFPFRSYSRNPHKSPTRKSDEKRRWRGKSSRVFSS